MRHLILCFLACATFAADLTFFWDANDPAEEVIAYRLYSATNVTGPYALTATTTNGLQTNLTVTDVVRGQAFYYVTASNFWGESLPSAGVNTPKIVTSVKSLLMVLSPDARRYVAGLAADRRPKPPLAN